jgi:CHASE3 domain sensor protein
MMKQLNWARLVYVLLTAVIILIGINASLSMYNGSLIVKNNELKRQTEQVKLEVGNIISGILHGADLSVRGYALTRDEKLAEPLQQVIKNKDSIFMRIERLLAAQHYDLTQYREMKTSVLEYLTFTDYMIDLTKKDSMKLFIKLLSEDRGYNVWVKYKAFYEPLFQYEDQLNEKANAAYRSALRSDIIVQVSLLLLGGPSVFLVIFMLRRETRERTSLLKELDYNNRRYIFDSGEELALHDPRAIIDYSISNFRKADSFISGITEGNYHTEWEGLTPANAKLNAEALSGKIIRMRDQLKALNEEEQKRMWATEGLARFSEMVRLHERSAEELCQTSLRFIANYLNAQVGSLFVPVGDAHDPHLELIASFAYDRKKFLTKRIDPGNGILGQAFLEGGTLRMSELPKGYLNISSGLGEIQPSFLVIVPFRFNENTEAMLEIASLTEIEDYQISFLEKCGEYVASALQATKNIESIQRLLKETQVHA